jgi:hypothetical protein
MRTRAIAEIIWSMLIAVIIPTCLRQSLLY